MRGFITEQPETSKPYLKQQLLTSFTHIVPHVDKLRARHSIRINNEDVELLINNSTSVVANLRVKKCRDKFVWVTHITNPNKLAAKLLQEKYGGVLSYLEGALNLVSRKPRALTKELAESVVVKNFRKSHDIVFSENVIYFMQREKHGRYRRGKVFVMYGDKRCKLTNRPCCHLEERIIGKQAIESEGINSIVGALDFDWISYFQRRLKFYEIDFEELGIVYQKRMKKQGLVIKGKPEEIGRGLFNEVARVRNGGKEGLFIQELVKSMGRNRALREIRVLSNKSMAHNRIRSVCCKKNGKVVHIREPLIKRVLRNKPLVRELVRVKRIHKIAA
jgi:hypothetical protein